ncbi:MAG: GNAT family N-acetyltransferase [Candidatus Lustribacter sp.]|jgi:GNAT superfamily N-acetyltransferase
MVIEPMSSNHNRLAFACGNDKLDRYIHETAHQTKRKGLAATFVAIDLQADPTKILGYYSLSNFVIEGLDIPEVVRKARKLPAHSVGATLLGRLAVAKGMQGKGIGQMLIADALKRAYLVSVDVGSVAVVVDSIDANGAAWYQHFGFIPTINDELRLVLMMDTIGQLLPGVPYSALVEQSEFRTA